MRAIVGAHLPGANLVNVHLEGAHLEGAHLEGTHLEGAHLEGAHLEGAHLSGAYLAGANLRQAHLEGADLTGAYLASIRLPPAELARIRSHIPDFPAYLPPADLREAFLDVETQLERIILDDGQGSALLADVCWGGVELQPVAWSAVKTLGDEHAALRQGTSEAYEAAIRAYNQLGLALFLQGLLPEAGYYQGQAQRLQRRYKRKQFWRKIIGLLLRMRWYN